VHALRRWSWLKIMSDDWELHLSLELLKDFACGTTLLDTLQRQHLQNCEECRDALWGFRSDADVLRKSKDVVRKTRQTVSRLRANAKRR
jgi:hypothetical protein